MDYMETYQIWCEKAVEDKTIAAELISMKENESLIKERFSTDLSFGTAGLRGFLGAGTNAMNIFTVRKAAQGIANHLNKTESTPTAVVAYDSRHNSKLFAREIAAVMAANGIKTFLFPKLMPTPVLSFAVRHLSCTAGFMVTASHNPSKYNGMKAYGADGGQLTDAPANAATAEIEKIDPFNGIAPTEFDKAMEDGLITLVGGSLIKAYYFALEKESFVQKRTGMGARLKVAFTPLNGTGFDHVMEMLRYIGILDIAYVKEQSYPDGSFPTCPSPNPEFEEALKLGLKLGKDQGSDLLIATDPDADRLGVVVFDDKGGHQQLSGNEVGVLLLHYIITMRMQQGKLPGKAVMVRSIVSSTLVDEIMKAHGLEAIEVLTGFKNIAEAIASLEKEGRLSDFIFSYEEACGYLCGSYCRDKDAVSAAMLFCEMAAFYKSNGKSVTDVLNEIYETFGYYHHPTDNYTYVGLAGKERILSIMKTLREEKLREIAGVPVKEILDYELSKKYTCGGEEDITLPHSNVLIYLLENGDRIIMRPSGTEPKIKFYYAIIKENDKREEALSQHTAYEADLSNKLGLVD